MLAPPEREDFSRRGGASLRWVGALRLRFFALPPRWRNVGFSCCAVHTPRSLLGKPYTAATRASRRGAGARHTRRVDRADCFHGQKIGTIGTFKGNPPFAVAAVGIRQNPFFS